MCIDNWNCSILNGVDRSLESKQIPASFFECMYHNSKTESTVLNDDFEGVGKRRVVWVYLIICFADDYLSWQTAVFISTLQPYTYTVASFSLKEKWMPECVCLQEIKYKKLKTIYT